MGQAWTILNLDKKEQLHPHDFGDGYKFREFTESTGGTMLALATLLATPESMGDGGGDAQRNEWTGRWAGDRIVIVGDYTDTGPFANLHYDEAYKRLKFEV